MNSLLAFGIHLRVYCWFIVLEEFFLRAQEIAICGYWLELSTIFKSLKWLFRNWLQPMSLYPRNANQIFNQPIVGIIILDSFKNLAFYLNFFFGDQKS